MEQIEEKEEYERKKGRARTQQEPGLSSIRKNRNEHTTQGISFTPFNWKYRKYKCIVKTEVYGPNSGLHTEFMILYDLYRVRSFVRFKDIKIVQYSKSNSFNNENLAIRFIEVTDFILQLSRTYIFLPTKLKFNITETPYLAHSIGPRMKLSN